jgi:molybdopterin molybdotransferase
MNHGTLEVRRKPVVAILATGDELVTPGTPLGSAQIVSSNPYGIAGIVASAGAEPRLLGIAGDTRESLEAHFDAAEGVDLLITIGGASVGDHDLVAPVLQARGMTLDFWKIAMRPGKPVMFARIGANRMIGVPGNPVSSLICARLFAVPLIRRLLGLRGPDLPTRQLPLAAPLGANGPRAHYMRATLVGDAGSGLSVRPCRSQDSSLLTVLADADVLIARPPLASAAAAGDLVTVVDLDF